MLGGRLEAVVLLIELSVQLEVLSLGGLDLGTAALAVIGSAVVIVNGSRLRNDRVLGDLLVLS
jgi:hypothetical protein